MPATLYQHPSSLVTFQPPPDPRDQPVIAEPPDALPTDAQWARLEGFEAVSRLVQAHGANTIYSWLRMAATLHGEVI